MGADKRVILLTPSMSKGGAETQLLKVAIFLKSRSYHVLIISLKPIDEFNGELQLSGVHIVFLKNWGYSTFSNLQSLYRIVKTFKPTVVIAFMFIAIIFARLLKLVLKFKLIATIRISVLPNKWYVPFKITGGMDDEIVYNSYASKHNFEKLRLVTRSGIVINNSISFPEVKNGIHNDINYFKWVCIGHFRWNKDYLTLFKAIALIDRPNFRIDIIGELNDELWVYQVIKELDIGDKVNLLGFKSNARDWLGNADAFVLSSFSEGMPNAILEAMASGKPVVVTDIDGNHELVKNGNCGFLCGRKDETDMALKMQSMMDLPLSDRNELGANGRRYIEAHFNEKRIMGEWQALIDRIIS